MSEITSGAPAPAGGLDALADDFALVRGRLFGIAYRMLGSSADAGDLLQDVWVKWQTHDRATVRDATAFLVTVTTRLAINATRTARARRETDVGQWLPEPVDTTADPELGAVRGEALEKAVLVLLEKLSPTERAAFVLREAFDYPYGRIAEVLQTTEGNARKLLSRARQGIAAERQRSVDAAHVRPAVLDGRARGMGRGQRAVVRPGQPGRCTRGVAHGERDRGRHRPHLLGREPGEARSHRRRRVGEGHPRQLRADRPSQIAGPRCPCW